MGYKFDRAVNELKIYTKDFKEIVKDTVEHREYIKYQNWIRDSILKNEEKLLNQFPEYRKEIEYIKTTGKVSVFNKPFEEMYANKPVRVFYDKNDKLKYVMHAEKKVFYPGSFRDTYIIQMYRSVCLEQDNASAHRYLDDGESLDDYIVFDCGCAEANFTIGVIDSIKAAYLFEGGSEWMRPLESTFSHWKDKVKIENLFLGKKDNNNISLREYIEELEKKEKINLENDKIFIKMDIEGGEVEVLEDILPLFSRMKYLKLAVCLYHRQGDEKRISSLIPDGYKGRIRDGSILFLPSILSGEHKKLKYPFFRRGLIRIDSEYE